MVDAHPPRKAGSNNKRNKRKRGTRRISPKNPVIYQRGANMPHFGCCVRPSASDPDLNAELWKKRLNFRQKRLGERRKAIPPKSLKSLAVSFDWCFAFTFAHVVATGQRDNSDNCHCSDEEFFHEGIPTLLKVIFWGVRNTAETRLHPFHKGMCSTSWRQHSFFPWFALVQICHTAVVFMPILQLLQALTKN